MRKFAELEQSSNVSSLKKTPLRNGSFSSSTGHANVSRATELFTHSAASLSTSEDRPARSRVGSASASVSQAVPQPRGVANKSLSSADQSQSSMGGMGHPAQKDAHASDKSKEDGTPGIAAGEKVTQGEADPDMKTFLTIEIKDGRTTTSSSSTTSRGNIIPITHMTPRITPNALVGQRQGRSINPELTTSLNGHQEQRWLT